MCVCVHVSQGDESAWNIDVCTEKLLASAAGYKDTVSVLEEQRVRLLTGVDTDKADTNTLIFFHFRCSMLMLCIIALDSLKSWPDSHFATTNQSAWLTRI